MLQSGDRSPRSQLPHLHYVRLYTSIQTFKRLTSYRESITCNFEGCKGKRVFKLHSNFIEHLYYIHKFSNFQSIRDGVLISTAKNKLSPCKDDYNNQFVRSMPSTNDTNEQFSSNFDSSFHKEGSKLGKEPTSEEEIQQILDKFLIEIKTNSFMREIECLEKGVYTTGDDLVLKFDVPYHIE